MSDEIFHVVSYTKHKTNESIAMHKLAGELQSHKKTVPDVGNRKLASSTEPASARDFPSTKALPDTPLSLRSAEIAGGLALAKKSAEEAKVEEELNQSKQKSSPLDREIEQPSQQIPNKEQDNSTIAEHKAELVKKTQGADQESNRELDRIQILALVQLVERFRSAWDKKARIGILCREFTGQDGLNRIEFVDAYFKEVCRTAKKYYKQQVSLFDWLCAIIGNSQDTLAGFLSGIPGLIPDHGCNVQSFIEALGRPKEEQCIHVLTLQESGDKPAPIALKFVKNFPMDVPAFSDMLMHLSPQGCMRVISLNDYKMDLLTGIFHKSKDKAVKVVLARLFKHIEPELRNMESNPATRCKQYKQIIALRERIA